MDKISRIFPTTAGAVNGGSPAISGVINTFQASTGRNVSKTRTSLSDGELHPDNSGGTWVNGLGPTNGQFEIWA